MQNSRQIIFLITLLYFLPIIPISMVYNFRIAQITKQPINEKSPKNNRLMALIFDQYRKKYNGTFQNFVGGLGSYIYNFDSYCFRIDGAVSHIKESLDDVTTFSGTETDDILFTVGKNFSVSCAATTTLSGLFGFPTHRLYRLQHPDFGYSQIGTGIQLDGSYNLDNLSSLLYGARYIHFIPRKALDPLDQKHTFSIGNIGDILFAYKKNWANRGYEFGYTFRARFGAHISPPYDEAVQKSNYRRSNFYAALKYKFFQEHVSHQLIAYLSYGFDHWPKVYGTKYIVTLWGSWTISF